MKLFTAPSIDRIVRLRSAAAKAGAMALALALAACVSEPPAAPGIVSPEDGATAAEAPASATASGVPAVSDARRAAPPPERVVAAALSEPVAPAPRPAVRPALPADITVLSTEPSLTAAAALAGKAIMLPEPAPPKPDAALTPPKPVPAAVPALPSPEARKPEPAKAAPAAAVPKATPAAPKQTAAPSPKPEAGAATAAGQPAATPAEPDPKPAVILPATPASSARSVDASGGKPVAETRLETVRGERFELRFPGTGWLYLGDEEGKEGLAYETRRFEETQAVFALNPEAEGEYVLRFQRQNPVDQATEVSLVRVVVRGKAAASPAAAPPQASISSTPPATASSAAGTAPSSPVAASTPAATIPPAAATIPPAAAIAPTTLPSLPDDPAAILRLARAELDAKRTQSAIEALDHYLALYPYGNDELFYLYGLAYEQDTPFRNIKKAWESYKRVRDEYPRSARWAAAADRVAYLERHYFGLR